MIKYYLLGFLALSVSVTISYLPSIKNSSYYLPIGLTFSALSALCWFLLAREFPERVFQNGAVWDLMVASAYLVLPILFFNVQLTFQTGFGILLMLIGCALLH